MCFSMKPFDSVSALHIWHIHIVCMWSFQKPTVLRSHYLEILTLVHTVCTRPFSISGGLGIG